MDLNRIRDATIRHAAMTAPPGVCGYCGGFGYHFEQVDDDRPPMAVSCFHCQTYCKACQRDVPKKGHTCNAVSPERSNKEASEATR